MSEVPTTGEGDFLPAPVHPLLRILDACTAVLNALGTLLIVGVMIAINSDIAGRAFFGHPISGVPEMVSMSIVAIVFLQIAHSLRLGGLTRAEVLLDKLPPRGRAGLEALYCLIGAGFCAVLFNGLLPLFERAWTRDLFVGAIGDFTAPIWPVRLVMLVGTAALGLQFLARTARALCAAVATNGRAVEAEA
ncbi:TRAP transporter small permease [Pigmentiphaga sp. H8]|uniref:TRAP transporter small permease subunit n=1 Tax=unclassified Pigmentiphaga TaxID=2626614 RepID=UPI000F5ABC63|nr:TRAP transporter small permease [Pigmentiphaga sp. H8]AZG09599.1 TRAP transporter small permease [Pigmentiphaga sp. H8]